MKRVAAMLAGFGLLMAVGCGMKNYDYRIEKTLDRMKYERRLNENLGGPVRGKLEEVGVYLRPPKNLTGPTQAFQFAALEPGRFDVENTFLGDDGQALHVVARDDRPKPAAKKGAAPQPEAAPRGDFNEEVVEMVRNATGAEVSLSEFKQESRQVPGKRQSNAFLVKTIAQEAKELQVYLYGSKSSPHKVALIFEYPTTAKNAVVPKIGLSLETFAVGDAARQAFSGGEESFEGEEGGEPGPPI